MFLLTKKSKKPELYEIIKSKKQPPVYKVDEFLKRKGHEVLRLPPYHCEFNPIELIWGDLKGYIGRKNSTFKLNDVKNLIQEGFSQIDKLKWLRDRPFNLKGGVMVYCFVQNFFLVFRTTRELEYFIINARSAKFVSRI